MRIAVIQCEGMGNCIMSTPMISAMTSLGHEITVVYNAARGGGIAFENWEAVKYLYDWKDPLVRSLQQDLIVWCHPDWGYSKSVKLTAPQQMITAVAKMPGEWLERFEKHEVEYLMDMAIELGYSGLVPPLRIDFNERDRVHLSTSVAIGIGYMKNGRWEKKHWGDENYASLCSRLLEQRMTPIVVGDEQDQQFHGNAICANAPGTKTVCGFGLRQVVNMLGSCRGYIGNDTGLMHAAAAIGIPTLGIFCCTNPVKNRPWCNDFVVSMGAQSPDQVYSHFRALMES